VRWLILIAALGGAGLGILFPQTSGASHVGYQVWITPPGGEDNTHIQLNCGWHTGCGAGIGGALDWYDYAVNVVYFRGGFYREGTPLLTCPQTLVHS